MKRIEGEKEKRGGEGEGDGREEERRCRGPPVASAAQARVQPPAGPSAHPGKVHPSPRPLQVRRLQAAATLQQQNDLLANSCQSSRLNQQQASQITNYTRPAFRKEQMDETFIKILAPWSLVRKNFRGFQIGFPYLIFIFDFTLWANENTLWSETEAERTKKRQNKQSRISSSADVIVDIINIINR